MQLEALSVIKIPTFHPLAPTHRHTRTGLSLIPNVIGYIGQQLTADMAPSLKLFIVFSSMPFQGVDGLA
jgi:hypothetical protein